MPTNMPPEYFEVEKRYKAEKDLSEKILLLEELIGTIPKHKGTDKIRAGYRKKLSKMRIETQSKKCKSKHDSVYNIEKEGAGQVVIIGPSNVGKSALLSKLTHAKSETGNFPFTTFKPIPGMMSYEDVHIQLVDTPPLTKEHVEHELYDLIKRSNMVLLVVNLHTDPVKKIEETLVLLENKRIFPLHMMNEFEEQSQKIFKPFLLLVNKYDDKEDREEFEIFCELLNEEWPMLPISAFSGRNLDKLRKIIFENLRLIRIYSKVPGKPPDLTAPFILHCGATLEDFAEHVHHDFVVNLKSARMWGTDVYDGQMVSKDHVLNDKDIVELHM